MLKISFNVPLMILAAMALGSTVLMFYVEETYLTVIAGIFGMVSSFATAGYWLSSMTNVPGAAWLFGGMGLVCAVWSLGMAVMTFYPQFGRRMRGEDPL